MSLYRQFVLRANALCLGAASVAALHADIVGVGFGLGPQGAFLSSTPHAAVGFIEAHGLAFIFSVLLWHALPKRSWHLAAAAVHLLLGSVNVVFWPFFETSGMLAVGYATTLMHGLFVLLHAYAVYEEAYGAAAPCRMRDVGA